MTNVCVIIEVLIAICPKSRTIWQKVSVKQDRANEIQDILRDYLKLFIQREKSKTITHFFHWGWGEYRTNGEAPNPMWSRGGDANNEVLLGALF